MAADCIWPEKYCLSQDTKPALEPSTGAEKIWAVRHGMAPVLAWYGQQDSAPGTTGSLRTCQTPLQRAWLLSLAMQKHWDALCVNVTSRGQAHHRPVLVFKGQALAHAIYPHPALRARSDMDILVRQADRDWWHNQLQTLGFCVLPSRQGRWVSFQNTYVKPLPGGRRLLVDMHWRINNRVDFHRQQAFSVLAKRATALSLGRHQIHTLNSVDALQLAVFHYYGHRPEDRKHLWLYDVALLWPLVAERNNAQGLLPDMAGLLHSMRKQLERVFTGCVFPSIAPKAASQGQGFMPYAEQRQSKWRDFRHRWRQLESWKARWGLLADYLFQPRTYVARRFSAPVDWRIWLYYPRMWWQDFRRLLKRH